MLEPGLHRASSVLRHAGGVGVAEVGNPAEAKIHVRCCHAHAVVCEQFKAVQLGKVFAHGVTCRVAQLNFELVGTADLERLIFTGTGALHRPFCGSFNHGSRANRGNDLPRLPADGLFDNHGVRPGTTRLNLFSHNLVAAHQPNRHTQFTSPDCKKIGFANWRSGQ